MSEEPRPSARQHDQRRSDGAPAWWAQLERGDLPDDAGGVRRLNHSRATGEVAQQRRAHRLRSWLINSTALVIALLVIMLGVGVDSARGAIVAALIFGVPMLLVAVTASVAARRYR